MHAEQAIGNGVPASRGEPGVIEARDKDIQSCGSARSSLGLSAAGARPNELVVPYEGPW
jgi:hypothetical protein